MIKADAMEETHKQRVKEALCFLAPEQTGSVETTTEDHRTDLYSLGILFWCLIVGQGQVPFEGSPMEILHAVAQKRPMPVHEVRRDVPHVLAQIIEKVYMSFGFNYVFLTRLIISLLRKILTSVTIALMV